jgi:S-sulfo-L-cysteine synthase (O-acetyl-L-serine-dependent)
MRGIDSLMCMSSAANVAGPRTPPAAGDLIASIGNTPLFQLRRIAESLPGVEIYAKAEFFNPGGSVKDRPALNMINEGERSGRLTPDKIILDSTSGNTGIAYAMIAAARGYKVKLCLPANASPERKSILKAYGAEMILTEAEEGSDGAIRRCQAIYAESPDRYFYPDQYSNPANWQAHYYSTGLEILAQTEERITHFVAAMGTSGTFVGTTRRLKEHSARIQCVSAQPSSGFHGLEGLKHMPTAIVPKIYDPTLADENLWLDTEDGYRMAKRLAREEGLLVGISAGANVHAALTLGKREAAAGRKAVIVTILCDGASKYLSEPFWNE